MGGDDSTLEMKHHLEKKPHAVCIPYPAQGHITPMLKLAKILHSKGFHITFVNTEFNHQRLLNSRGPDSLQGLPDFRFETIPDGLPPSNPNSTQDIPSLCENIGIKNSLVEPFRNLLNNLNTSSSSSNSNGCPTVTCIVSDGVMSFTLQVAKELGIPDVLLWTASVCGFMGYLHYRHLIEKGLVPLKDESYLTNGYLDTKIDWIPGMKDIRLKDIPTFIRTTSLDDIMLNYLQRELARAYEGTALIFNTFHDFENMVLDALKSQFSSLPPIYTIGPLQLLLPHHQISKNTISIGSNLWKEEPECLKWLDSKEPNSVIYVNFGSIAVMTAEQLMEFSWGLANSNHPFLWIIRPDLVVGDTEMSLSPEFVEKTKERGMLARWCPQEEVLNHPSVGGFLTHGGWNSILESVTGGVPVLCWPFFAEQQTNCRYLCTTHWGMGMEMDNNVKRDVVEELVRELMEGEKGKEMKKRAMEWKKKAEEATAPGGSSYINMEKIVKELYLVSQNKTKISNTNE